MGERPDAVCELPVGCPLHGKPPIEGGVVVIVVDPPIAALSPCDRLVQACEPLLRDIQVLARASDQQIRFIGAEVGDVVVQIA